LTKGERRGPDIRNVKWVVVLGGGHTSDPRLPAASKISKASLARLVRAFDRGRRADDRDQRSEGRGQVG